MPYVNQTRHDPYVPLIADFRVEGSPRDTGDIGIPTSSQTTTSWRSNARTQDPDAAFNELSGPEMARQLQSNYRTRYDNGHEFSTSKEYIILPNQGTDMYSLANLVGSGPYHQTYKGAVYPKVTDFNNLLPDMVYPSSGDIIQDGTSAIRQTVPTKPEAGLITALLEFGQKMPELVGLRFLREGFSGDTVGKEHLNLEFGINSTIRDVEQLALGTLNFHRKLEQYVRDGMPDRAVRRKLTLYSRSSLEVKGNENIVGIRMSPSVNYGDLRPNFIDMSDARLTVMDEISTTVRFSGCYTYCVDQVNGFLGNIAYYDQLANKLLGARITPSTIWELTPWSWLVGWFFNASDLIANISSLNSDNLVMRYGYIMHHTVGKRTVMYSDLKPAGISGSGSCPASVWSEGYRTLKTRHAATPYGFGLNVQEFTPRRLAILMALGLTKAPGKFRAG